MVKTSRLSRQVRSLLLLSICVLILGAVPLRPTYAVPRLQPQSIDNSLQDFTSGTFLRSALSAQLVGTPPQPQPKVGDIAGAVQLVPLGILSEWFESAFDLPEKLTDLGTVAIGNHIFAIGGVTSSGARTDHAYSTTIDPSTGALGAWQVEPNLTAIKVSFDYPTALVAARAVPAVAAVATGPDSGFIYVMGGSVKPSIAPDAISSYGVNIGVVAGGRITTWLEGPQIPDPNGAIGTSTQLGLQSASGLSFTIGGQTYIYLIGGLQRYIETQNIREYGSKEVFYARVNRASGQLVKPSSGQPGWDKLAPLPVPDPDINIKGLWDASAVASHVDVGGGAGVTAGDVLYVMGGQDRPIDFGAEYSSKVYRALINSNGTLTWQPTPPLTMPEARIGFTSVEFRGSLYLIGGRPIQDSSPQNPQRAILTSYVEDNLALAQFGPNSNFLRNDPDPLRSPRTRHGTVIVPATPTTTAPNAAYVYVIGGQGQGPPDPNPEDDQASAKVTYGKIGGEDRQASRFAPSGWYYSSPHNINFDGAELQQVNWTTTIDRSSTAMDIEMQYRVSKANDCNSPSAFVGTGTEWRDLDGSPSPTDGLRSINSGNSVNLGSPPSARCFQYRARLTSASGTATPALLNVSILVNLTGSPDLKVHSIDDSRSHDGRNSLTGLSATIINRNDAPGIVTQAADLDGEGSFFVDLFVFLPGQTPSAPVLPLSDSNRQGSKAYANISKSAMAPGATLQITQWCKPNLFPCDPLDVLSLFPTTGTYTVYVAVDSYGYVPETPLSPAEQNNVTSKVILVPDVVREIAMPLIAR